MFKSEYQLKKKGIVGILICCYLVISHKPIFSESCEIDSFSIIVNDKNVQQSKWEIILGNKLMYDVSKNRGQFILHAFDSAHNLCLAKKISITLSDYPVLKWAWKAVTLPDGAREDEKRKNDSVAGIIIGIKKGFSIHAVKYVWSTTLSVGSAVMDSKDAYDKVIVLQSGKKNLGKWEFQKVNVRDDIEKCFGKGFSRIEVVSIMTDSDNTKSSAEAYYAAIEFAKN